MAWGGMGNRLRIETGKQNWGIGGLGDGWGDLGMVVGFWEAGLLRGVVPSAQSERNTERSSMVGDGECVGTLLYSSSSYIYTRTVRTIQQLLVWCEGPSYEVVSYVCMYRNAFILCRTQKKGGGEKRSWRRGEYSFSSPRGGIGWKGWDEPDRQVPFLSFLCPRPAAPLPNQENGVTE